MELLISGALAEDTLVWCSGRPEWIAASHVAEIVRELPPPLPGAPRRADVSTHPERILPPLPLEETTSTSALSTPAPASATLDRRRRRHRHRLSVIVSPWWRRWLIPFLLALVGLAIGLWLYLEQMYQPPTVFFPE